MNSRFGSASCVGQLHRTNPKGSLSSSSKDGSVEVGVHDFDKTLEYLSNDDNSLTVLWEYLTLEGQLWFR